MKCRKTKICFVSLNAYSLLDYNNIDYTGGAEVQQVELAKELKKRNYDIYFIIYSNKKNKQDIRDGININPVYEKKNINNLFLIKKIFYIWKKMKEINADIYIYRCGSPGIVSIFSKVNKKKMIRQIASDSEVSGQLISKRNFFEELLIKIADIIDMKFSNVVISQNSYQEKVLGKKFNIKSLLIKNAFKIHPKIESNYDSKYVLWIGTIRRVKQPELFLEIAKNLPKIDFVMIGGKGEEIDYFYEIRDIAKKISNLEFMGFVKRDEIFNYYKKAKFLVNTSRIEGFPNVFLEAWMYSKPVVSLNVNPDEIITKYKMGYYSKTYDNLISDIRKLAKDKHLRISMGNNGRKYVEQNHEIKKIADEYEEIFEKLLNN